MTNSVGLKEAVQFPEYATLDFRNFLRCPETKWPPARVRSASNFGLNFCSEMLQNWRKLFPRPAWAFPKCLGESESTDYKDRSDKLMTADRESDNGPQVNPTTSGFPLNNNDNNIKWMGRKRRPKRPPSKSLINS